MRKKEKKKLINLLFLIILMVIIAIFLIIIFKKTTAKVFKIGNNKSNQEIIDYILNISSYNVKVTIDIKSNKNSNKYILKQKYTSPNISEQEVIEPTNIAGIKIINDGNNLKVENSKLDLVRIFENYQYLGNNELDLSTFIEDYKSTEDARYEENDEYIIMKVKEKNKYMTEKKLYIDKKTYQPSKMEIKDNNQKNVIYILYNEVKLKSTIENDTFAFNYYKKLYNI